TFVLFAPTPWYHLAAGVLDGNTVIALRESPDAAVATWLAEAVPHQAFRESLHLQTFLCGEAPLTFDAPVARIAVPLLLLGGAGGYGDAAVYTTTQVASRDVTTRIVRRFGPDGVFEDFGHADLLFARDAPALAWAPLAAWILAR